jgi:hypothetical protein
MRKPLTACAALNRRLSASEPEPVAAACAVESTI